MVKFIRVALWNANGMKQHQKEIKIFLAHNQIDVLLISETHFTKRTCFSIPYYKIYTTNHPDGTAHGGTAIVIKHTRKHYEILKYTEDFLQATSVKVSTLPYELTITAVYCPPKHNIQQHDFQNFFQTLGPKFLAGVIIIAKIHCGDHG
jgi:exonuclease III